MRNSFINTVTEFADSNDSTFIITGDAGYGVFEKYIEKFPHRFINVGVAEQNMISFAAGMAMGNFNVFVYNIIPFVLYRCYEQVRNDICYQKLPVTLVGIGSGVTYAPQGMTHYSVEDLLLAKSLPNLRVFSPIDPPEAIAAANYACLAKEPIYVRLAKRGEPAIHTGPIKDITKPSLLQDGEEVAILFHGSIGDEIMRANGLLMEKDITVKLISMANVIPVDFDALSSILRGIKKIITVEEHFVEGGLGSIIAEWIIGEGRNIELKKMGIKNEYVHEIRNCTGMREHYKFSANDIKDAVEKMIRAV